MRKIKICLGGAELPPKSAPPRNSKWDFGPNLVKREIHVDLIKVCLCLFLDHVQSGRSGYSVKLRYLCEFLSDSEILNFFEDIIIGRIHWNRPHRPIGRPNWPNRPYLRRASKIMKNMTSKYHILKWPKMAKCFNKNFLWSF